VDQQAGGSVHESQGIGKKDVQQVHDRTPEVRRQGHL
jgi:hypothetical protein